ncbi:MAG: lipopolysaccharide heptosyltransferase 1, partial [Pseudomonadota bacterium]
MKALVIKTSSMGDIIHTFPALTDASKKLPNLSFDWIVEDSFSEIPKWHPNVDKIIKVSFRRWRKTFLRSLFNGEYFKRIIEARKLK